MKDHTYNGVHEKTKQVLLSISEDVQKLNFHPLVVGIENSIATLKNSLVASLKIKYTLTM